MSKYSAERVPDLLSISQMMKSSRVNVALELIKTSELKRYFARRRLKHRKEQQGMKDETTRSVAKKFQEQRTRNDDDDHCPK